MWLAADALEEQRIVCVMLRRVLITRSWLSVLKVGFIAFGNALLRTALVPKVPWRVTSRGDLCRRQVLLVPQYAGVRCCCNVKAICLFDHDLSYAPRRLTVFGVTCLYGCRSVSDYRTEENVSCCCTNKNSL